MVPSQLGSLKFVFPAERDVMLTLGNLDLRNLFLVIALQWFFKLQHFRDNQSSELGEIMPTRREDKDCPTVVPAELGGKWVAWNADHTRIVAHASTLPQLWQMAQEQQFNDPIFEKVPRSDVRFVGVRRSLRIASI